MINLVRNELIKIFSKKAIYVYTIVLVCMLVFLSVYSKHVNVEDTGIMNDYVEVLEENLDNYDLSNEDELDMYVGDRVLIDVEKIASKYKSDSPERYYIDNSIEPLIYDKYRLEYIEKDKEAAKELQLEIDKEVKSLTDFNWRIAIEDEIKGIELEIESLKGSDSKDLIETLKIELWCLNYRLDNDVPYSYTSTSTLVDEYQDYATKYLSVVKDESLIVDEDVLRNKREIEEKYHESLYRLENGLVGDSQDMIDFIVDSVSYVDDLIILAIIIIAGSVISEEFNKGTIKQLLTKPHSRCKILASKIIASLIAITAFVLVYNVTFILVNCYEHSDFTSILGNNVVYDFNLGKIREISVLGQCLYGFVSVLPAYLIIFFFVILIGILSTSTIATVGSTLGIYLFYDVLSLWLKPQILAYLPFYCWDLTPYMFGGLSTNKYASFGTALIVDIVTILGLVILSFIFFKKKEIKNQ